MVLLEGSIGRSSCSSPVFPSSRPGMNWPALSDAVPEAFPASGRPRGFLANPLRMLRVNLEDRPQLATGLIASSGLWRRKTSDFDRWTQIGGIKQSS